MLFWRRTFVCNAIPVLTLVMFSYAQNVPSSATPKHFDHVLIVVLENQSYESAIQNDLLKSLAQKGAIFSNFGNLYHYSYPNYLAMIAGSDFGTHRPQILSDNHRTSNQDTNHKTLV